MTNSLLDQELRELQQMQPLDLILENDDSKLQKSFDPMETFGNNDDEDDVETREDYKSVLKQKMIDKANSISGSLAEAGGHRKNYQTQGGQVAQNKFSDVGKGSNGSRRYSKVRASVANSKAGNTA